jgi:predicted 2-oxoglutarate/Fe(II)-dependent dioxygenase YbiX
MLLQRYVEFYPKVLPLRVVSTLIKYCSTLNFQQAEIDFGRVDESVRKVHNYRLDRRDKSLTAVHWGNFLSQKIFHAMNLYIHKNNFSKYYRLSEINQVEILKYEKTYHYEYHVDAMKDAQRTLSAILFLNNDYEGGELCFKNTFDEQEINIKAEPGGLVVWPSNFLFPHTVKPIKKGIRYSVVAWGF